MNSPAPLYGLVLTGGRSRRFGRDKAAFEIAGETLLQRTVELLAPLVAELRVSVRPDQVSESHRAAYPLLVDQLADGPGAGLLAAHAHAPAAAWLVLACDLPLINPAILVQLSKLTQESDPDTDTRWDAIVPIVDDIPQPLHAIYHRRCLPAIRKRLAAGQRRVICFFDDVRVRFVDEEEIRPYDSNLHSFLNVNTPQDWTCALSLLSAGLR